MGATSDFDRLRLKLEDILADLMTANEHLKCAALKAIQAQTQLGEDVVTELLAARERVEQARHGVSSLHPNGMQAAKSTGKKVPAADDSGPKLGARE